MMSGTGGKINVAQTESLTKFNDFFHSFLKSVYSLNISSRRAVSADQIECYMRNKYNIDGNLADLVQRAIEKAVRNGYLAERNGR